MSGTQRTFTASELVELRDAAGRDWGNEDANKVSSLVRDLAAQLLAASSLVSTPGSETPSEGRRYACKCGDPTCVQWRENVVCAFCSAKLREITSDPEFEGRAGDMGEGHYADCPHGAARSGCGAK